MEMMKYARMTVAMTAVPLMTACTKELSDFKNGETVKDSETVAAEIAASFDYKMMTEVPISLNVTSAGTTHTDWYLFPTNE